jgi:starch-binding outer membrane protein, SusD/RagB family
MKKNILSILFLSAVILFSACRTELLDPVPLTSFSDLSVFDNPSRVEQQARGLYASVKNGAVLGGRYFVYHDIRSNDFINETTNNVTGFSVWNHTVQPSNINDVTNLWNGAYLAINRANVFLAGIDANEAKLKGQGMTDDQLNAYRGEARFLRSLMYYSLIQLYARPYADNNGNNPGLPLRLTANVSDGSNDLIRSSVADVYTQILNDLNFAESNLPLTRTSATANTTRAHRNTAIALKTRVYLHMGRWNDVVTESNKIVSASAPFAASSGVANALMPTVAAVFTTPYTTVESIFSMPFTENDLPGTQNGLGSYYNPGPRGIGDYSLNPAGIIGDTRFHDDDTRRAFIFNNPSNSKLYWNKFPAGPQHLDYAPVIRYAEVLLNLAEARARVNGIDAQAIELLNAVRVRSDADGSYEAADFATAQDLVEAILLERHIEFLGEGFTASDLSRNLRPFKAKQNVAEVAASSTGYIWPIPAGELITNKQCAQNPGY